MSWGYRIFLYNKNKIKGRYVVVYCVGSPKIPKFDYRVYIQSRDFNLAVLFQSRPRNIPNIGCIIYDLQIVDNSWLQHFVETLFSSELRIFQG